MALFDRKRTNFDISTPYYTIGDSKTILVIGLGNPGKEYAANRFDGWCKTGIIRSFLIKAFNFLKSKSCRLWI